MAGIFRSGSEKSNYIHRYTGLQIQTSSNAVPINIVYGTNRVAPNAIWTGGFFAIPQYQKQGGKGGGGQTLQGYEYYTSFMMGVCEGEIYSYRRIFANNAIYYNLWWAQLAAFSNGSTPQLPWGYLSAFWPGQALNYNGLTWTAALAYPLGSTPSLPQFSFEVMARLYGTSVINEFDADPALMIEDFLTNAQYGVGFPPTSIDATTLLGSSGGSSYQTYCQAAYLALSGVLSNQESANSVLTRWLKLTNTAAVWSGGKLKFIPFGDASITGPTKNGNVTFNPNITPAYDLTDDDFIYEEDQDPVVVIRSDPFASFNWQRISIAEREHDYAATPIEAFDQNAIDLYGLRMAGDITANEICDHKVGQVAAQLILQRQLYIRNTYSFKLSFEYCLLEPMDIVTLTDSRIGLDAVAVRIMDIEEDDDGLLAVTAEEFPAGTGTAAKYPVQTGGGNSIDQGVVPARVNTPIIHEPPPGLTGGIAQVWAAVSGGIAPVYKLDEDNSAGQHSTSQTLNASETSGTAFTFGVYAKAAERSALRLAFDNGPSVIGCDFNLATGIAGTPDAGIKASITDDGDGWFLCVIEGAMAAAAVPSVSILIENPAGTQSYAGTAWSGIYIWGAQFAAGTAAASFLPAFTLVTGAALATSGVNTPIGASGVADPNWGGAFVWLSADNITFGQIGTVRAPARQGVLTASLAPPPGANPDTGNTLSVSLVKSGGQLANATQSDAENGITLCLVENELLAYANALLTGANAYDLTYLYRGFYGTAAASHPSGAPFVRVDDAIFKYDLPPGYIGIPLYMKFQSFNIFGRSIEDLSECTVYTYTPSGAGQGLGPVALALAAGSDLDYGLANSGVNMQDDFGLASAPSSATIDLGLASTP